jgi:uncharacterized membrane protein YbhN (UPF0104 family)
MQQKYTQIIKRIYYSLFSKQSKNILSLFAILMVFFLLIYSLFNQREILLLIQWDLNFKFLSLTILIYLSALFVIFFVWYLMINRMGFKDSVRNHLIVFSKSIVARRIPLAIWYIGSRFYFYPNSQDQKSKIAVATLFEIMLTGLSGLFISLIIAAIYYQNLYFWIIILAYIVFLFIGFSHDNPQKKLINTFSKIFQKESEIKVIPSVEIWRWFFIYGLSWLMSGFTLYFGIKAIISIELNIIFVLLISAVSGLIGFISMILPAGFGLKEITTGILLTQSLPFGVGLLLGIVNRFFTTLIEVIWSALIILIFRNNP